MNGCRHKIHQIFTGVFERNLRKQFGGVGNLIEPHHFPPRRLNKIHLLPIARNKVCFCAVHKIVDIRAFRPHSAATPEVNRATG